MAKVDVWLTYQREVIDGGVAVATIVLEGPDSEVLQTWPIAYGSLETAVEGELQSQREQLPKGRHQLRLLAKDTSGAQVAQMTLTVSGSSSAQSELATSRLMQERANALQLSNVEKIQALSRSAHEFSAELFEAMRQGIADRDEKIARLEEVTHEQQLRLIRESAQQERLTILAAKFAPTIEMGIAVAGQYLGEWIDKRQSQSLAPKAAESEPHNVGTTTHNEPTSAVDASGDPRTTEPETDGSRCTAKDSPSSAAADGRAASTTTKPKKRK
jgi:hypothetical protein